MNSLLALLAVVGPSADNFVQILIYVGIVVIFVVTILAVLKHLGVVIPYIVYLIAGAVVGILVLIWIGKMFGVLS